jgi:hypothetical protein
MESHFGAVHAGRAGRFSVVWPTLRPSTWTAVVSGWQDWDAWIVTSGSLMDIDELLVGDLNDRGIFPNVAPYAAPVLPHAREAFSDYAMDMIWDHFVQACGPNVVVLTELEAVLKRAADLAVWTVYRDRVYEYLGWIDIGAGLGHWEIDGLWSSQDVYGWIDGMGISRWESVWVHALEEVRRTFLQDFRCISDW